MLQNEVLLETLVLRFDADRYHSLPYGAVHSASSLLMMVAIAGYTADILQAAVDGNGLEQRPSVFRTRGLRKILGWAAGEAEFWDGHQDFASQLQIFASRHKWAIVYDIKNYELRTSLQSVVAADSAPRLFAISCDREDPLEDVCGGY